MSELSGCIGKKIFYTYESAKRAAKRRNTRYDKPTRSYKCPHCACWHHTTKPLITMQKEDK